MKTTSVICTNCKNVFEKSIYYIKQNQKRGSTNHFCTNKCSREYNKKINELLVSNRKINYYNKPKKCLNCNCEISYEDKSWKKYCSSKCFAIHSQKNGGFKKYTDCDKKKLSFSVKDNSKFCGWNKKEKIKKDCEYCKIKFEVIPSLKNKNCCSRKCKNEWIKKTGYLKNKGLGGFRNNSGTSKKGWYKGYFCGSSWELAWVIFNIDHNIKFDRNFEGFEYMYEGIIRKYYPDFKINDEYIEIKGYHSKQFDAKQSQFPHKLKVLHKSDLRDILHYVINKYGKKFTYLYEK